MLKAIIFDFDGVIIDSETKKFSDMIQILQKHNLEIDKTLFSEFIGKKRDFFLKQQFSKLSKETIQGIVEEVHALEEKSLNEFKLIKGLKNLLLFLQQKKMKMVITSGSKEGFIETILKAHHINDFFDFIISGEMFHASKPDPECYQVTLNQLKLAPEECLVIEDSIAGITAAKKLKIPVIGLSTYHTKKELHDAEYQCADQTEILSHLRTKI